MSPIFVIGNPRSGTTLLRLILDSHSQIVIPPECGFAVWWHKDYKTWTAADAIAHHRRAAFINDLKSSTKIEGWGLDFEQLDQKIQQEIPVDYATLVDLIYRNYAQQKNDPATIWGDKNNFHINHIDILHALFPKARYVFIVRDGRDVACSYKELNRRQIQSKYAPNLPDDIEAIATEWSQNNKEALNALNSIGQGTYTTVRYEDMVSHPGETIQQLVDFLSLPFEGAMLKFFLKRNNHEPEEYLQWKEKTRQAITNSQVGRYKKELELKEIAAFESIAASFLEKFDYQTDAANS